MSGLPHAHQMLRGDSRRVKKIGIFAGTFDPVHNGHLAFAEQALEQGLDKVYLLPEPRPRRKQGVRALEHRIAMINIIVQGHKQLGSIKLEQARFTPHETLPILQKRFENHQLVLLFGDDVIKHIADWPHIAELVNSVELIIATRHDQQAAIHERFKVLKQTNGLGFRYTILAPSQPTVSSSQVRRGLAAKNTGNHLASEVLHYINHHNLYQQNVDKP